MSDDPGRHDDEPGWAAPPGGEPSQPPPTDPWGNPMPQSPATPQAPGAGQPPPTSDEPSDWWGDPAAGGGQTMGAAPTSYGATPYAAGPPRNEPKAIWGLVLSIVGLVVCGLILSPIAVVLGFLARKSIRESYGTLKGDGLAIAAIVIGIVGFILAAIILVAVVGDPEFFDELESQSRAQLLSPGALLHEA